MKISGRFLCGILAGAMSVGFVACDSDDNNPTQEPAGAITDIVTPDVKPGAVDPTVTGVLNTTEAGDYIENTAKQLDAICNPADQQQSIDALVAIADVLDSYDFSSDAEFAMEFAKGARKMARGIKKGDLTAAPRAAQDIVYDLDVNPYEYLGIYTPVYDADEEEYIWTRTASSANSIIFKSDRDDVEVVFTVSSNSWTGKFTTTDWDYDYDPSTGDWSEFDVTNNWTVKVPAKVNLNMGYRGESAASAIVESNFNESAHNLSLKASAKLANIVSNVQVEGTDTVVTEISNATVDGTRIMYSTAKVSGNGLCDADKLTDLFSREDKEYVAANINNIFTYAVANVDLLDRIQLTANCSTLKEIIRTGDECFETKAEADAFAKALNNNIMTALRFGNTSYDQGSLTWGVISDYDGYYTEFYVAPLVQLSAGGSPMSLEEFFESSTLNGAYNAIKRIVDAYSRLFD